MQKTRSPLTDSTFRFSEGHYGRWNVFGDASRL